MKAALVDNTNTVVNVVVWADGDTAPAGLTAITVAPGVRVAPGWTWDGTDFVDPTPPPPVRIPQEMTFAQLMIGLVTMGWITEAEGELWLTGTVPPNVSALINSLPQNQRFAAKARASRPSVVQRNDSLVLSLAQMQGVTSEQLDQFFTTFSQV